MTVEAATPNDDDGLTVDRERAPEWRALGALLAVPGVLCTWSLVTGGALNPLAAGSNLGDAIVAATGLLGVLSGAFGGLLLVTGRLRRSATVLVVAWAGLLLAELALAGVVATASYLWLPQLVWLGAIVVRGRLRRSGRATLAGMAVAAPDTGWRLLGLALVVPGLWLGRSIVYMRLLGEPWAAGGSTDLVYWLVQAIAVPSVVAGAWMLVSGRGRRASAAVAIGCLAVAAILATAAPDLGLPVTLTVPAAWLGVLLAAAGVARAAARWQAIRADRAAARATAAADPAVDAPGWRKAATRALVLAGGFAFTLVVVASVVH